MSKWKCEICGSGFDNFHAQGFDNMIYCPLCYFKKLSADLQVENEKLEKQLLSKTLPKDSEDMWITYNLEVNKILQENEKLKEQLEDITLCRDIASAHRQEVQDRETILLNQQQEFIKYLEKEMVDCKAGSGQQYYAQEHLKMFKEIIGKDINVRSKETSND